MKPQNLEETIIWYYITGTLVLYFLGAQFVVAPMVCWSLTAYFVWKLLRQNEQTPPEEQVHIPIGVWVWLVGIAGVAIALVVGHIIMQYDLPRLVRSFINFFMRTYALLALLPLIGCLNIRPQLIYRAVCILCLQCLILIPIAYAMGMAGISTPLYVNSVLARIGGIGRQYYQVSLYINGSDGLRLYLFAPWAPALGFVANVYFHMVLQERVRFWRWVGIVSTIAMAVGSGSRLGMLCLVAVPLLSLVLHRLKHPVMQIAAGVGCFVVGLVGTQLLTAFQDFQNYFHSQRASSSRIRSTLADLAIQHWRESPIWGHALRQVRGPQLVEFMPVGSHHTWFGLLYTHGLVGLISVLIPVAWTLIELLVKAQDSRVARTALSILIVILLYSFGENIETLSYIIWPGFVVIGIALKEHLSVYASSSQPLRAEPVSTSG